jgi:putative peptide zinc metalloprotease protein
MWEALAAEIEGRHWRPELAPWVEVRAFATRGGRNYAMAGNRRDLLYFRLEPGEVGLLPLLDGTRTLGEIVVAHLEQSGALDTAAVVDLVRALHASGFLTDPYVDVDAALERALTPTGPSARLRTFARTLTIDWSGAERLAQWCYARGLRYLFRPVGVLLAMLVGLGGIVAFAVHAAAHGLDYEAESLGADFALLFALNLLLIFFHELGHATVLVHYGRRVRGAGFRISLGSPAFYVDSSDALMLGRKARVAQSFGGTYFELLASGIAAIALWQWPDSDLAPTLYSIVFLSYFVLLLNLTPMLELDGYYILSDVIRVPDLRPRALAFLRRDMWVKVRQRERWTAPEVGLFLFGTLGFAATVFFLASALWFWEWTFGDVLRSLWRSGPFGKLGLLLLLSLLVGPVVRAAVTLVRAAWRRLRVLVQRVRFRAQRRWRVEAAVALGELPLFDDLSLDVFHDITHRVELVDAAPGLAVFRQGDKADAFYASCRRCGRGSPSASSGS